MTDSLATYLHDHMAGANSGVHILEALRDEHRDEPLGRFAAALLVEIEADRAVLQGIIDGVGKGTPVLKEAAAWVGEKVSELKTRRSAAGALGTFEALEMMALGILGKLELWRALPVIAELDGRVRGVDFDGLAARAQRQYAQVEEQRLMAARDAFGSGAE